MEAPACVISRLNYAASVSAAYASSDALPHPHARLASGRWLACAGWESSPLDSIETFPFVTSNILRSRRLILALRQTPLASALDICLAKPSRAALYRAPTLGGTAAEALRAVHLPYLARGNRPIGCVRPARIAGHNRLAAKESLRSSRLPDPAGFLGAHGRAFGALSLAELLEVLDGAVHAHPSH
jgi:hypothetical protein